MTGDALGTPRYMAPEQLRGISNARSNVYNLGTNKLKLRGIGVQTGQIARAKSSITMKRNNKRLIISGISCRD